MSPRKNAEQPPTFEQAAARLDEIVARMEQQDTSLEEMIHMVEEGLGLIRRSRAILTEAELRIRKLEEQPEADTTAVKHCANPSLQSEDGFSLL